MNTKFRYGLIILGVIIFIIFTPLIILFVSGKKLNWTTKQFISTGIIAFKVDPKDAKISLNLKEISVDSSEFKQIRNLPKGQYILTINKPLFFNWEKKFQLEENKVLWAKNENSKIILLKIPTSIETILNNVSDLLIIENKIFALSENYLYLWQDNNHISTPNKILLSNKPHNIFVNKNYETALTFTNSKNPEINFIDLKTNKSYNLNLLFPYNKFSNVLLNNQNTLFGLTNSGLYEVLPINRKLNLLENNVINFSIFENSIYFISQKNNQLFLETIDLNTKKTQLLTSITEPLTNPKIFITKLKNIYIADTHNLYEVAQNSLNLITNNITSINLQDNLKNLIWLDSGELTHINQQGEKQSITRSSENIKNPLVEEELDYTFYSTENNIYALEINKFGGQNNYKIFEGENIKKFYTSENKKNIWVLDNNNLKFLNFR